MDLEKPTIWLRLCGQAPRTDPLRQTDGQGDGEMDFPGIRRDRSEGSEGGTARAIGRSDDPSAKRTFTRTIVNRILARDGADRASGRCDGHQALERGLLDYLAVRFAEDG